MMEKVRTKQQQQLELEAAKRAAIEQLQNVYEQHKLQQVFEISSYMVDQLNMAVLFWYLG